MRVCVCACVCGCGCVCVCVCAYLHKYTVTLGEYMGYTWGYRGTYVGNTRVHTGDMWGGGIHREHVGIYGDIRGALGGHTGKASPN